LRIFAADGAAPPVEVFPPRGPRMYWTRRGVAEWLVEQLRQPERAQVGIDHGFSFPLRYFNEHDLPLDWPAFLDDFQRHWPTDEDHVCVDFVRDGICGDAAARFGNSRWRRLTEIRARAKSVFHFDVQGSVAKATHAALPWLRYVRRHTGDRLHCWPFDGWDVAGGRSVLAEAYPALWSRGFPREKRNGHQHDAYSIAAWLQRADRDGSLTAALTPDLTQADRGVAAIEGWILGVR
jgi:hypothetical protein